MLKGLFGPKLTEDMKALQSELKPWAASLGYEVELTQSGHLRFKGETAGHRWRLTAGPSSRIYFKHGEIKVGLSADIKPEASGVICTRRLATLIKQQVYGEATAAADTHSVDNMPFEMTSLTVQRERMLPDPFAQHIECHGDANALLETYAEEFLKALPGGLQSIELNTLLPWIVTVQEAGIILRLGVPTLALDHVKSLLRMQVALIRPLRLIAAPEGSKPHKGPAPDSLPSR